MRQKDLLPRSIALCVGVLLLSGIAGYAILAWTEPGTNPPGGTVAAPINTGNGTQTKQGDFNIMGKMGIGNSSPAQKLDVSGRVKGTGLCIGSECCDNWDDCVTLGGGGGGGGTTPPVCKNLGETCLVSSECCAALACSPSSKTCVNATDVLPQSACKNTLTSGNRRIFVTAGSYKGSAMDTEAKADAICYNAALGAGIPSGEAARFYAFAAIGSRDPNTLLSGAKYWNGVKIAGTTNCEWYYIGSPSTIFSNSGIDNPINHDQWGNAVASGVTVTTSFKAVSGAAVVLNSSNIGSGICTQTSTWTKTGPCLGKNTCWFGGCAAGACMYCCDTYKHWYGLANSKTTTWAYAGEWGVGTKANCMDQPRALYCVEKY